MTAVAKVLQKQGWGGGCCQAPEEGTARPESKCFSLLSSSSRITRGTAVTSQIWLLP